LAAGIGKNSRGNSIYGEVDHVGSAVTIVRVPALADSVATASTIDRRGIRDFFLSTVLLLHTITTNTNLHIIVVAHDSSHHPSNSASFDSPADS
jgi:hypothetical protein